MRVMNFSVLFIFVVVVCSLLSDQAHAKKRGCRCPHLEADGVLELTLQKCWRSSECPSGLKCCRVGTVRRCVKPEIVDLDDIRHWETKRKDITDDEMEPEGQSQLKEGVSDRHDDRDDDDDDHHEKSKHKWHIIKRVGCLMVIALAVVIVAVMAVCCMRRRQLRRQLMMRRQLQYQHLHQQQQQQDVVKAPTLNLNVISASDLNKEALKMSLGLDYTPSTLSAPPSYEQLQKEKEQA